MITTDCQSAVRGRTSTIAMPMLPDEHMALRVLELALLAVVSTCELFGITHYSLSLWAFDIDAAAELLKLELEDGVDVM
jgi:hypothetical protein